MDPWAFQTHINWPEVRPFYQGEIVGNEKEEDTSTSESKEEG